MKMAAKVGDIQSGHACYPPTPAISGVPSVLINGVPALTVGSNFVPHACSKPHAVKLGTGSSNVIIGGKPAGRLGDRTACGGIVITGSANVLIGG